MPRKLGQHFLKNKKKIKKIIDYLELEDLDKVLEIGPGKGALTKELGNRNKNLNIIAVERDEKLINYLRDKVVPEIKDNGNKIEIIYGNILSSLPEISKNRNDFKEYKIVGNIPYYITGKLFRVFEEMEKKPKRIILTVQKEVADRIDSKPPNMNILSASIKYWANAKKLINIPKKDFDPVPDVDSAVIELSPKKYNKKEGEKYYKIMNVLFSHPRKTVLNNLSLGFDDIPKKEINDILNNLNIKPNARPQNLSISDITSLSKSF